MLGAYVTLKDALLHPGAKAFQNIACLGAPAVVGHIVADYDKHHYFTKKGWYVISCSRITRASCLAWSSKVRR